MVDNNTIKSLAIAKKNLRFGKSLRFFTICNPPFDINTVSNMGKMNYNLRKTVVNDSVRLQIQSQDNASSRDIIDDSDPISDANTGLTQNFQDLSVKQQFHTTPGTILFIPDTVNKLYKVQVLENSGHETKIRYSGWGSEHDTWFNAKSVWAYSKHKHNLKNRKKITKEISDKIDLLLASCEQNQLDDNFLGNVEQTVLNENKKLPSLQTIVSSHVPTCRFVPVKFRTKWSQLLTSILDDCATTPDDEINWQKLFSVSKCILRASNRGGKKHKRNQDQRLSDRIDRWNAGEYANLWTEALAMKQARKKSTNGIEELASRAKSLCLQGQFGLAAKILSSEGLAPNNRGTLKALEELHPKEVPPTLLQPDNVASSAYQFSDNIVFEQLKTFSQYTAAGPSKMYPEHLLHAVECTAPDHSESALKAITRFVNTGSRGNFPSFVSKALCSASLTALSKKKGGVRPIAVSEILRRLIAKCLVKEAKSEAIELFDSIQLGVGVSGGAEAIIHSAKITYEKILNAESNEGVLQIDFRNAFNSVKRSHLLQAACDFIPGIAAFTYFCYSQHVPLLYNNASLQSESGVQQGDPLGPLLFSLTLWPVIEKIRDAVPNLTQHTWYLDDGFVAGSEDQIRTTLDILANEGPKRGLYLRKDQCELWSIVDLPSVDREVTRNMGNGFEVLGAAVGSPEFVSSCLQKRVRKVVSLLDNLSYLDDPQCALGILRY